MDEARKAIPLRRKQTNGQAPQRTTTLVPWSDRAWALTEPPRQLWLATLGGTAITVRTARAAWDLLVSEGRATERWLLGPRSGSPGT